jgi:ABC-type spermidine/putrescine transport system permease subunit II
MSRGVPLRQSRFAVRAPAAETAIMGGASLILVYLAVVPVATMIYASLHTGFLSSDAHWSVANYSSAFSDPTFYRLLGNSALYGGGVAALAVVLGFGLAFLYVRTDAPLRSLGMTTALVPLILPGILNTVAWLFLASPRIGLLNDVSLALLHLRPFNVYSLPGMIFVQAMHVAPTAFILAVATFTSMDLVAFAVEDVEDRLVDVAVHLRLAARGVLLEVDVQRLAEAVFGLHVVLGERLGARLEGNLIALLDPRELAQALELVLEAVLAADLPDEHALVGRVVVGLVPHGVDSPGPPLRPAENRYNGYSELRGTTRGRRQEPSSESAIGGRTRR